MPSEREGTALESIARAIAQIDEFVAGMTHDEFVQDAKTFHAVTRCLEIISEASRRLSSDLRDRHPDIRWRAIAAAGNIYRHAYDSVDEDEIWNTATRELCALRIFVRTERSRLA